MRPRRTSPERRIAIHARPRALATRTRSALERLGYTLTAVGEAGDDSSLAADLRIVDDRQLDSIPGQGDDTKTPIVLLIGGHTARSANGHDDPRIVGRVPRPAQLSPLYGYLQRELERTPRKVPRVSTQLPARWILQDRLSVGAILSLSESGCLLRTAGEKITRGMGLKVQFALPAAGLLSIAAECIHSGAKDLGLAFQEPSAGARRAIGGFVTELLSA